MCHLKQCMVSNKKSHGKMRKSRVATGYIFVETRCFLLLLRRRYSPRKGSMRGEDEQPVSFANRSLCRPPQVSTYRQTTLCQNRVINRLLNHRKNNSVSITEIHVRKECRLGIYSFNCLCKSMLTIIEPL